MIYPAILLVVLLLSFVGQEFVPRIEWAYSARLLVVHLFFFCSSITVSFPVMLVLAFTTGFLWDARHVIPDLGGVAGDRGGDLAFGYSILLFGLFGALMQGIRPLFRRGRWELPVLMTGIATFFFLVFEYLLINLMRGGFYFPRDVWFKIVTTALLTTAPAPLVLFTLYRIAGITGYRIRFEGLAYR